LKIWAFLKRHFSVLALGASSVVKGGCWRIRFKLVLTYGALQMQNTYLLTYLLTL